jgi:serine/threonine protein kinase
MFFDKYKNKRSLGRGAFGQVYLVEDKEGKEYAMKLISVDAIKKEPYLMEYLDGEIECMKTMDSPYIIKLYDTLRD